ncbi:MAG: hypothetical protein WC455_04955 [Dehalococcoidia bacterium]|jgi:hypothetical protein
MKARYIFFTTIAIYLIIVVIAAIFVITEETETETTPTVSNCEQDENDIQTALDAYYDDHTGWPTANGQSGDIIWDELVPEYMAEMPLIDSQCDWQVSSYLEGQVCVAHTC